jgi:hypothetical protein
MCEESFMSAIRSDKTTDHKPKRLKDWERQLIRRLPLFGHRNWIVVADSAFPCQSHPGISTVVSGCDQLTVVSRVIDFVNTTKHLKARIYLDEELSYVSDRDAMGISTYRKQIAVMLGSIEVINSLHDDMIRRLDQAARVHSILVIKTTMALPYTSVFLELDCGYWSGAGEGRLRTAMINGKRGRPVTS